MFPFIEPILSIIDKIIPDRDAAEKAKQALLVQLENGDLQRDIGQLTTNQVEAANSNIFVSGWRPFIGWVCGSAFAYHYIIQPMIIFIAALNNIMIVTPTFDMGSLMTVMMGMLGLGGLRTFEKYKAINKVEPSIVTRGKQK